MRAFIMAVIAAAGIIGLVAPAPAMPTAPRYLSITVTSMEILQHCEKGYHRENGWQDKQGAFHGKCVPRPAKKTTPS
jgi:hypothetical protein